ncbi:MAG: UTRA domain-containing protein [Alphaproteobacteria bacterium]|nr:UTRA domain-containing protein [Alphaproteobacteria bacterium]
MQAEVRRRIQTRVWKPGDTIPTEVDLAKEFNCARATINRALRELAETGLLERRRKSGTRVSLNPMRKATLDIPITRLEIEGRGQTYRHKLLESQQVSAPDALSAEMNLGRSQMLVHLKTLHMADGRPFMYEDRWINPKAARGILRAKLAEVSANEWLVQNVPISHGDIAFQALGADTDQAAALGVTVGTALFIIDRLTWMGTQTVTKVRLAYGPGYRMVTQI